MAYNFVNDDAQISLAEGCFHDTKNGYSSDFSENGNVDSWEVYNGIHIYGAWGGFLFGTFHETSGYIGRSSVFIAVPAEYFYTVKIVMKINPVNNTGNTRTPTTGKMRWRTLTNTVWDTDKEIDFDITADNQWHSYILNMGPEYYWQGDINDLRIYPLTDAVSDNEFFIRSIKIQSVQTFRCVNYNCSYYSQYTHPCPAVGDRTYITSGSNSSDVYVLSETNDEFKLDINDYGEEVFEISHGNYSGSELAKTLAVEFSKISMGGYAEISVTYSDDKKFIIKSGMIGNDNTVVVHNSSLTKYINFYDSLGNSNYTTTLGEYPATGFRPKSSFTPSTFQLLGMFDNKDNTSFEFDPGRYAIEGGRVDILANGFGTVSITTGNESSGVLNREYDALYNYGKTIIDFTHPFNSSGNIKKIILACTYDTGGKDGDNDPIISTGCKVIIFRPQKDGSLKKVTYVDIPDKDEAAQRLYSTNQEILDIDCDIWVGRGDLIGVYNINLYVGKVLFSSEADASYYQADGESGSDGSSFDPGKLFGNGNAGLLVYARSDYIQQVLDMDVDLQRRINIDSIVLDGESKTQELEFNIARCLDINWQVDLLGSEYTTGYWDSLDSIWNTYEHDSVAYGIENLYDGVYSPSAGLAADNYSVAGSDPVVSQGNHYFYVNGDEEWLGVHHHTGEYISSPFVEDFNEDPMAIYLRFPLNKKKYIYKSVIYFKDRRNFRNLALSYYLGDESMEGNSDHYSYQLFDEYSAITIDGTRYSPDEEGYEQVDDYLFQNPTYGKAVSVHTRYRPDGMALGYIDNYEAFLEMQTIDWNIIKHEFESTLAGGFRIYTDLHYSTKINEIELFCIVDDVEASLSSGFEVVHSHYGDLWWPIEVSDVDNTQATAQIDDTPRYVNLVIEPITTTEIYNITFTVNSGDVYVGEKGCKYEVFPVEAQRDVDNRASTLYLKNVYGKSYNLYIDIAKEPVRGDELVFYSKMNDAASIDNPEVGPGGYYIKNDDYLLKNANNNCIINCPVYGLKNLLDGKEAYYSEDAGYTWNDYGTLTHGTSIDLENVPDVVMTYIKVPTLYRSRYWKLAWFMETHSEINIREIRFFYRGNEIVNGIYYHEQSLGRLSGPLSNTAPHLNNGSIKGSYYSIVNDEHIAVDFGSSEAVDGIMLFHDVIDACTPVNTLGEMDLCTIIYLRGDAFDDLSYYNSTVTTTGPGATITSVPAYSFDGTDHIVLSYNDNFDLAANYTIDLFVTFNSLPSVGEEVIFMSNWPGSGTNAWKFRLYNDAGDLKLQLYTNGSLLLNYIWSSGTTVPAVTTGVEYWLYAYDDNESVLAIDGVSVYYPDSGGQNPSAGNNDILVGKNLNGTMRSIRLSNTRTRAAFPSAPSPPIYTPDLTEPDGNIQADSEYSGSYLAIYAFNDNTGGSYWNSAATPFPHWIGYGFVSPKVINVMRIYNTGSPYHADWFYIQGSNDISNDSNWALKTWYTLTTVSGSQPDIWNIHEFDNDIAYQYYRLYATENFGGNNELQVKEIELKRRVYAYEPYMTMSLYASDNDSVYVKYCDLDLPGPAASEGYYYSENKLQEEFNTYLAVDLSRRYDLEIIRSYGASDATETLNTTYSYSDTTNVEIAFGNQTTTSGDARWVFVPMLNGDSTSRIIRKLGIYPRIQTNMAPNGSEYNTEWEDLGTAVTTYVDEVNLAPDATITASSEFYGLSVGAVANGDVTGNFGDIWGSDGEDAPWIKIDLTEAKDIYKVIIYHSIDASSTDFMVRDYTIETSTDDVTYTTRFTVTSNSSYEKTHQLADAVSVRYIKINITDYDSMSTLRLISESEYGWFEGAVIREIKVYEDYGYSKISSEDYPVICVNMNYQFYLSGMTLIGMDPDDTSTDWNSAVYAFSDSVMNDPEKINFEPWAGAYSFERWVAIKQNTATEYDGGPNYLKHIRATSTQELNPCDYSKWWHSDLSTLSEEYMYVKRFSTRSMKIEYPTSSGIEDIYFYEGDDFGVDEYLSWRDGFSFWLYIDNVDNLDMDYGYFKFGGADASAAEESVEYRWDISTISGSLQSGWNGLFLRPKDADEIIYTEPTELLDVDVRIPRTVTLKTIGFKFRGIGNSITMYWNGFGIVRNTFQDTSVFSNGLYLTSNDFMTCPINELDLSHGTIEFNLTPDYNYKGFGYYNEYFIRSLFHITNSANDVFGALFTEYGLQIYYGNVDGELGMVALSDITYIDIDNMFNIAFVFSNTGEHIDNDGSTIRVYVDNFLIGKITDTWDISDNKYFKFLLGGKSLLALKEGSVTAETTSVGGVASNLKIYNYCKTDFSDVLNTEEIDEVKLKKPSELIEISKDNLTFYKVGSEDLPLAFSMVAPGTIVPVYVRPVLTRNLTGAERRTASLVAEWDVTV